MTLRRVKLPSWNMGSDSGSSAETLVADELGLAQRAFLRNHSGRSGTSSSVGSIARPLVREFRGLAQAGAVDLRDQPRSGRHPLGRRATSYSRRKASL